LHANEETSAGWADSIPDFLFLAPAELKIPAQPGPLSA